MTLQKQTPRTSQRDIEVANEYEPRGCGHGVPAPGFAALNAGLRAGLRADSCRKKAHSIRETRRAEWKRTPAVWATSAQTAIAAVKPQPSSSKLPFVTLLREVHSIDMRSVQRVDLLEEP